ncbi:MAG: heat-shock protein Hsp20 [Thermofilum sp. ex4484_79]|nr:MAG: heat-shock protein Hsp20 [Thermofilum sp. ex4484_79]
MKYLSEFDEWWKRTRRFFEEIDRLIDEMIRESMSLPPEERRVRRFGPYVYGFSMTIGPDGIPRIREWGNIKPGVIRPHITEELEPFTDVIDEKDKFKIVIDMPGVEKEDINVEATEDVIEVSARRGDRKYYKRVVLPEKIRPETAKAQYKNGVLTITVEKLEKKGGRGFTVKVE